MTETARTVAIEIVSDVVCPWCYIGKRRLEKALAMLDGRIAVNLTWLPFQLNPDMTHPGMPRDEFRIAKFGSIEHARSLDARVAAEGRGDGITFAFDRIARVPNTFAAHQLIDLAQEAGQGDAAVEALFRAFFEQGRDTGDSEVLKAIGAGCGVSVDALVARWADAGEARRLLELEQSMKALGIRGVPAFIFDRRYAVSGAHPPETMAGAIREAVAA